MPPTRGQIHPRPPRVQIAQCDGDTDPIGQTDDAIADAGGVGTLHAKMRRLTRGLKDDGAAWTSVWGVAGVPVTSADISAAAVDVTDAPTAGQKIVITDYVVTAAAAMQLTFTEETSGTVIEYIRFGAPGTQQITARSKRKLATANKKLRCQSSAAGAVTINVGYYSEA